MARGDIEAVCARPDLAAQHMQPIQAREPQDWRENPPNRGTTLYRAQTWRDQTHCCMGQKCTKALAEPSGIV